MLEEGLCVYCWGKSEERSKILEQREWFWFLLVVVTFVGEGKI